MERLPQNEKKSQQNTRVRRKYVQITHGEEFHVGSVLIW